MLFVGAGVGGDVLHAQRLRVIGPALEDEPEPQLLAPGDERFRQVAHGVEQKEPVAARHLGVHPLEDHPGRDVVECGEAVRRIGEVLREPQSHASATVVADDGCPVDAERLHQRLEVPRHGPLVVAGRGLLRRTVAAQVRHDQPVVLAQHGDLVAPGVPGLREAMQEDDGRAGPCLHIVLLESVRLPTMVHEFHVLTRASRR